MVTLSLDHDDPRDDEMRDEYNFGGGERGRYAARLAAGSNVVVLEADVAKALDGLLTRITIDPEKCGGRPCVRGLRVRVTDILDLFAAGLTSEQILAEMPDLETDDLKAALWYASRRLGHPVVTA